MTIIDNTSAIDNTSTNDNTSAIDNTSTTSTTTSNTTTTTTTTTTSTSTSTTTTTSTSTSTTTTTLYYYYYLTTTTLLLTTLLLTTLLPYYLDFLSTGFFDLRILDLRWQTLKGCRGHVGIGESLRSLTPKRGGYWIHTALTRYHMVQMMPQTRPSGADLGKNME